MAIKNKAFTLTEILLAVAIVGIIAALVMPATISKFRSEVLDFGFKRQEEAIKTAVDLLVIKENKTDFGETSMYSDGSKSMEDSAGKFIKRYLRVSKYYGDATVNKALIKKECFADTYYEYADNTKKELNIDDYLGGACAKLKNGASICLVPQIRTDSSIQGIIDINGQKGPNVYNKDLRSISLGKIAFNTRETVIGDGDPSTTVATEADPNLTGEQYDCANDYSTACCNNIHIPAGITSSSHGCCSNSAVSNTIPACAKDIVLRLNFYPTSDCTYAQWKAGTCSDAPYISNSNSYAHEKGSTVQLSSLPVDPPSLNFYCDGTYAGFLSVSQVKAAVINPQSYTYVTRSNSTATALQSKKCNYESASKGIVSGQGSFAFPNGSDSYTYKGVNWWVEKY